MRPIFATLVILVAAACPPRSPSQDPGIRGLGRCARVHSPGSTTCPRYASDVCDRIELPDLSQLPPDLAGAGCTKMGSYQLGLGHKPVRYAICPADSTGCVCPSRVGRVPLACTPVARFLACFGAEDLKEDGQGKATYGWAHVVTSVCDACLGSSLPAGMVLVVWHQAGEVCFKDSDVHTLNIEAAVPGSTLPPTQAASAACDSAPTGGSGVCPQSGCQGGCMNPGQPNF
jgi:hypothetical protein